MDIKLIDQACQEFMNTSGGKKPHTVKLSAKSFEALNKAYFPENVNAAKLYLMATDPDFLLIDQHDGHDDAIIFIADEQESLPSPSEPVSAPKAPEAPVEASTEAPVEAVAQSQETPSPQQVAPKQSRKERRKRNQEPKNE